MKILTYAGEGKTETLCANRTAICTERFCCSLPAPGRYNVILQFFSRQAIQTPLTCEGRRCGKLIEDVFCRFFLCPLSLVKVAGKTAILCMEYVRNLR